MESAVYKAKSLIDAGEDFVVAKVVDSRGSAPRKKGAWLIVSGDGACYGTVGGGLLEARVQEAAKAVLETRQAETRMFRLDRDVQGGLDLRCGGDVHVRFEYIDVRDADGFLAEFKESSKAFIFGAGHIGLALDPVLRHVGFETVIIDDRREFANKERFPLAEVRVIGSFADAFAGIETDEDSYIVIVTRGHAGDYEVLKQGLARPRAYIGMIGSRKKVAETFQLLRERDGFSQEQIDKVYSPVGLAIHAETPEEIAVSIAAEMISVRAGHGK